MPAPLLIKLKKGHEGRVAAFALHRADGSFTVQRDGNPFFPVHDLTHYAVESALRISRGFYGLVADGWRFEDFGQPWPRGPLPVEALQVEHVVGLFDLERATGMLLSAEEMDERVGAGLDAAQAPKAGRFVISADRLRAIREVQHALVERWNATPPGQALELTFDMDAVPMSL